MSEDWLGPTFDEYDPEIYFDPFLRKVSKSEERFRLKVSHYLYDPISS